MLTQEDALQEFRDAGALLEGHFILTSGYHSSAYLQCARVLMDARRAERLCAALAAKLRDAGLVEGLTSSFRLRWEALSWAMKWAASLVSLRFSSSAWKAGSSCGAGSGSGRGSAAFMVEDVVTTGLSSRECIEAAQAQGANVIAAASLADRSAGKASLPVPFVSLISLDIPHFRPINCQLHCRRYPRSNPEAGA